MDEVYLERLKKEEFIKKNIESIVKELNEHFEILGGLTFMMEGDSQTVEGREFVWDAYGSDVYSNVLQIRNLIAKVLDNL